MISEYVILNIITFILIIVLHILNLFNGCMNRIQTYRFLWCYCQGANYKKNRSTFKPLVTCALISFVTVNVSVYKSHTLRVSASHFFSTFLCLSLSLRMYKYVFLNTKYIRSHWLLRWSRAYCSVCIVKSGENGLRSIVNDCAWNTFFEVTSL